jgi:cystathionine beta-lyase/cystathionine gamma-synthase
MIFVETPTNPVLRLTDIAAITELAHSRMRAWWWTTPSRVPACSGLSVRRRHRHHSTTKYLNGHSDSIGGIVIATRDDDIEWLRFIQNAAGAILSPFDSWLVLRGTKTLHVRMAQHNANGQALPSTWPGTRR